MTTPAIRVSQTLHKHGFNTVLPESRFEGVRVKNNGSRSADISLNRRLGHPVVTVVAQFTATEIEHRRIRLAAEILTRAGYHVELPNPDTAILNVWEPNWFEYLNEPPTQVSWRADLLRDGHVLVHTTACPGKWEPRKSLIVASRTQDAVILEIRGKLLPRSSSPISRLDRKVVTLHECTNETKESDE